MSPAEQQARLVPRWFTSVTVTFLVVLTLAFAVTGALVDDGVMTRSVLGLALMCGFLLVATCSGNATIPTRDSGTGNGAS